MILRKGGEGVKKSKNFADVISGSPFTPFQRTIFIGSERREGEASPALFGWTDEGCPIHRIQPRKPCKSAGTAKWRADKQLHRGKEAI